jgi:hypothetical protein
MPRRHDQAVVADPFQVVADDPSGPGGQIPPAGIHGETFQVPSPYVGQTVHFVGQGSEVCMAAIITRLVPPSPGVPHNDRCELVIFSPITPHPLYMTAEHDESCSYTSWHWIHP